MKLFKKIMSGALALAFVVGATFALTGCFGLKGKEYTYAATTITVITKIEKDSEGKVTVTETKDLSLEEYYLHAVKGVAIDKLAENSLTEEEKKGLDKWAEGILSATLHEYAYMKKANLKFDSKTVDVVMTIENEWTGAEYVMIQTCDYEKTEDGYIVKHADTRDDYTYSYETRVVTVDANENLVYRNTVDFEEDEQLIAEEGDPCVVYSINVVYSEVK